ncbi:IS3 family transposase [Streptomyces sp. MspMP-M5]|uniref:IS3 family transposase n=1 Tax=Streptomyces sp. MspMP-M5 TaxID=1155718 RepID=UPI001319F959|nr:IS3 family transposase [Streptomyces sp. SID8354]
MAHSSRYAWLASGYVWLASAKAPDARKAADDTLAHEITIVRATSHHTHGVPRIHAEPRAGGVTVNRKRIERFMRQHGIQGRRLKRRHHTTIPDWAATRASDPAVDRRGPRTATAHHPSAWTAKCGGRAAAPATVSGAAQVR